ncbi:MAG: hypothetical protein APF80_10935 [Alphaproteobacteria bacterium BRH_c36]|nr:MAG: hypothetical protein APF80_10935 [Alphaproteobacteria bacterium BRH_c36]
MKRRTIVLIVIGVAAIIFATWPAPGIYLGHDVTQVRVFVPGEGERDHDLLLCRYISLDGYRVAQNWPADTKPGTLLVPNGEEAMVDDQDCIVSWPWSNREEG